MLHGAFDQRKTCLMMSPHLGEKRAVEALDALLKEHPPFPFRLRDGKRDMNRTGRAPDFDVTFEDEEDLAGFVEAWREEAQAVPA